MGRDRPVACATQALSRYPFLQPSHSFLTSIRTRGYDLSGFRGYDLSCFSGYDHMSSSFDPLLDLLVSSSAPEVAPRHGTTNLVELLMGGQPPAIGVAAPEVAPPTCNSGISEVADGLRSVGSRSVANGLRPFRLQPDVTAGGEDQLQMEANLAQMDYDLWGHDFPLNRERSRSPPPPHRPILPVARPEHDAERGGRVDGGMNATAFRFRPMFSAMPDNHGGFPLGASCWRALVGFERQQSGSAPSMMVMPGSEEADVRAAVQHAGGIISQMVSTETGRPRGPGRWFYIGITENPGRRWAMHEEQSSHMWRRMRLLVQAPDSVISASIERRLIARWRDHTCCTNVGPGGERASAGRPHYVYVLEGAEHGLMRRAPCTRGSADDM